MPISSTVESFEPTKGQGLEGATPFTQPVLTFGKTYEDGLSFPLMVEPAEGDDKQSVRTDASAAIDYLRQNRDHIFDLVSKHGAVHFRNFAADKTTPRDFANIVTDALGLEAFPYTLGNAVRKNIVGNIVFTANEAPADKWIPFHHELAQTPRYPNYVLFYCEQPAETDGETPVVYSPAVYEELYTRFPQFMEQVEKQGVIYSRTMTRHDRPYSAIGRGWEATFKVNSRSEAELALTERGYSWRWDTKTPSVFNENSSQKGSHRKERGGEAFEDTDEILTEISPVLPAVLEAHGKKSFFNQVYASWFGWRDELNEGTNAVVLADGSAFPSDFMHALKDILTEHQVAVPWKRGDFVLIDNRIAMHARNPFTGKRSILASLAN